jgi:hypothetical protein
MLTTTGQTWQDLLLRILLDLKPLITTLTEQFQKWAKNLDTKMVADKITMLIDAIVSLTEWIVNLFDKGKDDNGVSNNDIDKALKSDASAKKLSDFANEPPMGTFGVKDYTPTGILNGLDIPKDEASKYLSLIKDATGKGAHEYLSYRDYGKIYYAIRDAKSKEILSKQPKVNGSTTGSLLRTNPNALQAAQGAGVNSFAMASGGTNISHSTDIGSITINTQATDANGIAASIRRAMDRKLNMSQVNTALS